MTDQFHLQSGSLKGFAGIHDDVVAGFGPLTASSASDMQNVLNSHGPIASSVTGALGGVMDSRLGTFRSTSTASQTIAELLQRADQMYEGGDREGAEKLKAAADALEDSDAAGGPGTGAGGAAAAGTGTAGVAGTGAGATGAASAGGTDQVGQIAGQVGQIAGTLAQTVAGLAQGLTQLPQQIMQGVQGMVQSASQAGGGSADTLDEPTAEDREERDGEPKEDDREDDRSEPRAAAPTQPEGAQPGTSAEQGRAPVPTPPPVERPQPAQTRPQQDL